MTWKNKISSFIIKIRGGNKLDKYEATIKELRILLNQNRNLTSEEWNKYSKEKGYLSAVTILAREDATDWERLKRKLRKKDKKLDTKIEKVRHELNKSIEEIGLDSRKTKELSLEINELINLYYATKEEAYVRKRKEYPYNSKIIKEYKESYAALKSICIEKSRFLTTKEWNSIAKKNTYLSCQAMEYVLGLTWNEIREKILKEI